MSDDIWRRRERERDDTGEFGGPLFPDDPAAAADDAERIPGPDDTAERRLSFGPNDTGPLPHWTDPPTGEVPRLDPNPAAGRGDEDEEIDVWSSFTTETPIWRDDDPLDAPVASGGRDPSGSFPADPSGGLGRDPSGEVPRDPSGGIGRDATGEVRSDPISEPMGRPPTGEVPIPPRQPGRIQIGTGADPSGGVRRPSGPPPRRRGGQQRSGRPAGPARTSSATPASTRNMPAAIAAGAVLAALFIAAALWKPVGVLVLIVVILAVAGFEYFGKVTEKGYRPAVAPGLAAVVAAPLVTYWVGDAGLPLVVAFAFIAAAAGFLGASSVESGPLPNMAVTTLGVVWIGVLGSFAALILRWSNIGGENPLGTDTIFLIVLGVVANDIGALTVGSAIGRTPLRAWISPSKTVEGLLGGALFTIASMVIFHVVGRSDTWTEISDLLILGIAISVMAPLGDLTESMFKRNLDVKDFGTVLSGHGGVLDRFDAFLFTLPVAYYLSMVLLGINLT